MILVVSTFLIRRRFNGITLWPFVFARNHQVARDIVFINHEKIHLKQQAELLVVFFYVWYLLEFLWRWIQYKNRYIAYRNISFEREAYARENDQDYLKKRSFFEFIKYVNI